MQQLLKLTRVIDAIGDVAGFIAKWLVLLACLVSAGNAMVRYAFSYSSNSWLEIQWYMFGGIVLLGAAQTLRLNEHVRVDLLYSSVSERTRLWIDVIGFIVFLLPVTAYLINLTWPFFLKSYVSQEYSSNAGGLILWPAKLLLPAGFVLLWLQGAAELVKRIAGLTGAVKIDTHYEAPLQ
ncbi:TRAP transporter small permease subunit [Bradyrhizobium sp. U87765 SZCCT0131]|uniref:TRAP transporter small permease subunit n=1 Tax=unclassified Bradyrhizobium TaxID=2631580 RepID=UPI001BA534F1|nr:TRAP transporter small permease subunit [Bradyrhizobium sp. U87765 SZCCT0131]MBR1261784.1 TRAP transporter small permease subunit [Bradyrhizobium sp. U87765 SZCCT0134]MBR1306363.1 TRAP transporter small permease subunit [Bradyrhizobium sp. U87765 SZCCT0110]MBR1317566.1 TRAP transporter small permease subunit [Bradyrhizobium sp. U87765 SZCCT0109]MBR1351268.1 TRAP transporter small permease subunit [Bradyrhizobium sp. U87765 SZCCT0048]